MNTQDTIINRLGGYDKTTHFFAGAWLSLLMPTWYYALILAAILAVGKEVVDKYIRKQTYDVRDMLATFLGGLLSAGVMMIMTWMS